MNADSLFEEASDNSSSSLNKAKEGEMINIQNNDDPHNRYKMPKIVSRVKDKGKFAETYVTNLADVARALKVNLPALIKFLEINLGSQFLLASKDDSSSYFIKGRFDYNSLYAGLRLFIDSHVICSKCGLPEIEYRNDAKSKKGIRLCKSCGNLQQIDHKERINKLLLTVPIA